MARTSAARESRAKTINGARAGKRLTPDADDYATRLTDMLFLSQFGGRDRTMELFEQWVKEDPEAAFEWAASLSSGRFRFTAKVIEIMAARDLERAKEMFEALPESYENSGGLRAIVAEIAKKDPEAALTYFEDSDFGYLVEGVWKVIGAAMARDDESRALELLNEFSPSHEGDAATRKDIELMLRHRDLLGGIVEGWGRRDFDGLFRWADSLPNGQKIMAFETIGPLWMELDPKTAMNYLTTLGEDRDAAGAIQLSLRAWGKLDPQAARQWLESSRLPKNPFYTQSVYQGWIDAEPLQAMATLWMPGNEALREVHAPYACLQLVDRSPEEAAKLIPEIERREQSHVTEKLVEQWSYTDRKATEAWISSLDGGETRDVAIRSLVGYIADEDPAGAMRWLEKIDDVGLREEVIFKVGAQWLYRDEETGRQRLAELGVSESKIDDLGETLRSSADFDPSLFLGAEE